MKEIDGSVFYDCVRRRRRMMDWEWDGPAYHLDVVCCGKLSVTILEELKLVDGEEGSFFFFFVGWRERSSRTEFQVQVVCGLGAPPNWICVVVAIRRQKTR